MSVARIMATHRAYRQRRHCPSRSEGYGGMMPLVPAQCGWYPLAMATPPLWVPASALVQMSHWPKARLQKLPGTPSAWHRDKSWFSSNGSQSVDLVSRVQIWAMESVTLLTGGVDILEAPTHKATWLTAAPAWHDAYSIPFLPAECDHLHSRTWSAAIKMFVKSV